MIETGFTDLFILGELYVNNGSQVSSIKRRIYIMITN